MVEGLLDSPTPRQTAAVSREREGFSSEEPNWEQASHTSGSFETSKKEGGIVWGCCDTQSGPLRRSALAEHEAPSDRDDPVDSIRDGLVPDDARDAMPRRAVGAPRTTSAPIVRGSKRDRRPRRG